MGLILGVAVLSAHVVLVKANKETAAQLKAAPSNAALTKVFFGTIAGIAAAAMLAFATVTIADAEYRREFTALFETCERDTSKLKVVPLDTSADLPNGAKVTVHQLVGNVPQEAERPQNNNGWRCSSAIFVELSVSNIPKQGMGGEAMAYYNFTLTGPSSKATADISEINSKDIKDLYQTKLLNNARDLDDLEFKFLPQGVNSTRGWLVFPLTDRQNFVPNQLVYTHHDNTRTNIPLQK
ncbi:MAG: hypothetical protein WBK76_02150 [Candidatus Saccharimonadales bacterium]